MLLRRVEATNSRGSLLSLTLGDASSGFFVKEVEGLGPVNATLVSSGFANMDGEQYHSSRREKRNIVLKLGLEPDYATGSVQELRSQLYQYFMPKTQALLNFNVFSKFAQSVLTQELDLNIYARIESCEPDIFTAEPAMDVSLLCFDPDFFDPTPVEVEGMSVSTLANTEMEYVGTVETGIVFELRPDRAMAGFSIYHRTPDNTLHEVDFTYALLAGDVVTISSIYGAKRVTLLRAGVESSILYAISPQSDWLEFEPGINKFRVHDSGAPVPYTVSYTTKYGAI